MYMQGDAIFTRDQRGHFHLHIGKARRISLKSARYPCVRQPVPGRDRRAAVSLGLLQPFVIHPMLLEVVTTVSKQSKAWEPFEPAILTRAQRYA
jgi:hypothetical protein